VNDRIGGHEMRDDLDVKEWMDDVRMIGPEV
jgi:hypothetical protein